MALLLDLDGTLIHNNDGIFVEEALRVFTKLKFENVDKICLWKNLQSGDIFSFIAPEQRTRLEAMFWSEYNPDCEPAPKPILGAVESLRRTKQAGNKIFIITARRVESGQLREILAPFGFEKYVDRYYSQDPKQPAKLDKVELILQALHENEINPSLSRFVGDTPMDMYSASECKIPQRIGVLTGGVTKSALVDAGATAILPSVAYL